MIEAIYELTRAKMKETEIDGVPRTKNQVYWNLNLTFGSTFGLFPIQKFPRKLS